MQGKTMVVESRTNARIRMWVPSLLVRFLCRPNPLSGASRLLSSGYISPAHRARPHQEQTMTPLSKQARIVGFFYLLLAFVGPVRLIYVPTKLFVHGDAATTAANILAHETLFRLGIGADLFGAV